MRIAADGESLQLRVKDLDFGANQILIRDAKGMKDRITMLPASVQKYSESPQDSPTLAHGSTCPDPNIYLVGIHSESRSAYSVYPNQMGLLQAMCPSCWRTRTR